MCTFEKSRRYTDNWIVRKDNEHWLHVKEDDLSQFHTTVQEAVDVRSTPFRKEVGDVEVDTSCNGVKFSGKCADGEYRTVKLSYDQSRELLKNIEDRVYKDEIVRKRLNK
jgi:hypothetical protein